MTNPDSSTSCVYKTCTTASTIDFKTHILCDTYFSDTNIKCTVYATKDATTGVVDLGGCMQTTACSSYIHKE